MRKWDRKFKGEWAEKFMRLASTSIQNSKFAIDMAYALFAPELTDSADLKRNLRKMPMYAGVAKISSMRTLMRDGNEAWGMRRGKEGGEGAV